MTAPKERLPYRASLGDYQQQADELLAGWHGGPGDGGEGRREHRHGRAHRRRRERNEATVTSDEVRSVGGDRIAFPGLWHALCQTRCQLLRRQAAAVDDA